MLVSSLSPICTKTYTSIIDKPSDVLTKDQTKCTLDELETSLMEVIPAVSWYIITVDSQCYSHLEQHKCKQLASSYDGFSCSELEISHKWLFQNWDVECKNEHATNDKYKGRYIAVLVIMILSWLVIIGLFMYSRRVPLKHAIFN